MKIVFFLVMFLSYSLSLQAAEVCSAEDRGPAIEAAKIQIAEHIKRLHPTVKEYSLGTLHTFLYTAEIHFSYTAEDGSVQMGYGWLPFCTEPFQLAYTGEAKPEVVSIP